MESYMEFASLYDMLTGDVEYEKRADYIEQLFKKFISKKPELIADIGCGTGTVCDILQKRGYDMIGIDSSEAMLNIAREKNDNILYLLQNMTSFELYGTVDVILSMLDTVNYLTEDGELYDFLLLAKNYLNPSGLLIFDINSPYKFKNIFSDNIYNFENENLFYSWENDFDGNICEFYLNFFVKGDNDKYTRITEQHFERCYEVDEIKNIVEKAGLTILGIFGDLSHNTYKNDDERIFFVIKKY